MLNTTTPAATATRFADLHAARALGTSDDNQRSSERIAAMLKRVSETLAPQRRLVRAGDVIYQTGERFDKLFVLNSGLFKLVTLSPDGREQVTGLKFRGDWLGFDGIAGSSFTCDAVAMDTGEIWTIPYDKVLLACTRDPALMAALHEAMSREITGDRDSLMSVCTLPADARVADFLRYWAEALASRGLRNDQINLRMTRAEIGNYLGMTLESVSRALSRLAKCSLIEFAEKGRRDIRIPQVAALVAFVHRSVAPAPTMLQ
jgi:CRP/FNR family transcriptional regulator